MLKSHPLFEVDVISNKGLHIDSVIDQAKREAKATNKFVVKFECKLTSTQNQYPDVMIADQNNVLLQCELKDREQQSVIIKQINGMTLFAAKEFWYVLTELYDLKYIKSQVHNDAVRIMYWNDFIDNFITMFGVKK